MAPPNSPLSSRLNGLYVFQRIVHLAEAKRLGANAPLLLLCPGSRFRHHFLLAGAVVLNFVAPGANQTPSLAYVIFCRQAQWLRHVVFKTPAFTNENPSFFRCRFLMAGAVL